MLITWFVSERGINGRRALTHPVAIMSTWLCFGLTNAPAVFQAMINDDLRDFLNHFVYVYLDDILIYPPYSHTHVGHVRQVLQQLLENRLYVKA